MFDLVQFNEKLIRKGDIPALIEAVKHPNLFARCSAINDLGLQVSNPAVVDSIPVLLEALLSNDDLSSLMASITLGKLGNYSHELVLKRMDQTGQAWLSRLYDRQSIPEKDSQLSKLFRALGNIGNPDSLEVIVPLLEELYCYQYSDRISSELYRMTMLDALTFVGKIRSERGVDVLLHATKQLDQRFLGTIIWALGQIGGEKARNGIMEYVLSPNEILHHKALETLSQELTIFLSSTFRDMQEDRDALIAECIPRLRKECNARGIKMNVIDLRWGITPEDTRSTESLVRSCLHRIDQCQSHHFIFVGMLGYQYGHTCKWDRTGELHSMTEIEILHALTSDNNNRPRLSLFYLREPKQGENSQDSSARKAMDLRKKVEELSQRYPDVKITDSYASPEELSSDLFRDVYQYLEKTFPTLNANDDVMRGIFDQYRWHLGQLTPSYIPQENDFHLVDSVVELAMPVLITGGEGIGKTSLMCHWAEQRINITDSDVIITHNLHLSHPDQKMEKLYDHLAWELSRMLKQPFDEAFRLRLVDENSNMPRLQQLFYIFSGTLPEGKRLIILLDGFNVEDTAMIDTGWQYPHLPPNVHLAAFTGSNIQGSGIRDFQHPDLMFWNVEKLERDLNEMDVECIITRRLNAFGKELTYNQQKMILSMNQIKNPLFLQEVLSYLIRYAPEPGKAEGSFEDIVLSEMKTLLSANDLQQLYSVLLAKSVQKYGAVFLELIELLSIQYDDCSDDQLSTWIRERNLQVDSSMILALHDFLGESLNYQIAHGSFKAAFNRINKEVLPTTIPGGSSSQPNFTARSVTPHAAEVEELIESWNRQARERVEPILQHQVQNSDFQFKTFVSGQKDGSKELEKAIQKARDGTIIVLEPGLYSIPKTLKVRNRIALVADTQQMGESSGQVILEAGRGLSEMIEIDLGKVRPRMTPSGNSLALFLAEGITFKTKEPLTTLITVQKGIVGFKDCRFEGFHDSEEIPNEGGRGLSLQKESGGYVSNCVFTGFSSAGIFFEQASDFLMYQSTFEKNAWGIISMCKGNSGFVLECSFHSNYFGGIHTGGNAEMIVFDNDILGSGGEGLNFGGACTIIAHNNIIRGSVYDNVHIGADATVALVKNQILDGYCYGITAYSQNPHTFIYRNQIFRNNFGGIKLNDAFHGQILDNEVAYNLLTGITLSHHTCALVAYNAVHDNLQNGIGVFSDQSMPIGHNHCHSNGAMGIMASQHAIPILARNLSENNGLSGFYVVENRSCRFEQNSSWGNKEFGVEIPYGERIQDFFLCLKNAFGNIGSINYREFGTR